jgi:hypothetical protein
MVIAARLSEDASAQVRRECAVALHGRQDPRVPPLWARLAEQFDGQDRWYLEALGIAAEGQWDRCLQAWLHQVGTDWNSPAGRQLVWRSRAEQTPELLRQLIDDPATSPDELPRYLRALDFLQGPARDDAVGQLAFHSQLPAGPRQQLVRTQALARLKPEQVNGDAQRRAKLEELLDTLAGTPQFLELVQRFHLQNRFDEVLQLAVNQPAEATGIDAVRMLLATGQEARLAKLLQQHGSERQLAAIRVLGHSADNRALPLLRQVMSDMTASAEARRAAIQGLARIRAGAEYLIAQARDTAIPAELAQAVAADLHQIPWDDLRAAAVELYPLAVSKSSRHTPCAAK